MEDVDDGATARSRTRPTSWQWKRCLWCDGLIGLALLALAALLADAVVGVHGRPSHLAVVQLDLVRADLALLHLLVTPHELGDRARLELATRHVALDAVANLEAQRRELLVEVLLRGEARG